jgi:hypothetical protein
MRLSAKELPYAFETLIGIVEDEYNKSYCGDPVYGNVMRKYIQKINNPRRSHIQAIRFLTEEISVDAIYLDQPCQPLAVVMLIIKRAYMIFKEMVIPDDRYNKSVLCVPAIRAVIECCIDMCGVIAKYSEHKEMDGDVKNHMIITASETLLEMYALLFNPNIPEDSKIKRFIKYEKDICVRDEYYVLLCDDIIDKLRSHMIGNHQQPTIEKYKPSDYDIVRHAVPTPAEIVTPASSIVVPIPGGKEKYVFEFPAKAEAPAAPKNRPRWDDREDLPPVSGDTGGKDLPPESNRRPPNEHRPFGAAYEQIEKAPPPAPVARKKPPSVKFVDGDNEYSILKAPNKPTVASPVPDAHPEWKTNVSCLPVLFTQGEHAIPGLVYPDTKTQLQALLPLIESAGKSNIVVLQQLEIHASGYLDLPPTPLELMLMEIIRRREKFPLLHYVLINSPELLSQNIRLLREVLERYAPTIGTLYAFFNYKGVNTRVPVIINGRCVIHESTEGANVLQVINDARAHVKQLLVDMQYQLPSGVLEQARILVRQQLMEREQAAALAQQQFMAREQAAAIEQQQAIDRQNAAVVVQQQAMLEQAYIMKQMKQVKVKMEPGVPGRKEKEEEEEEMDSNNPPDSDVHVVPPPMETAAGVSRRITRSMGNRTKVTKDDDDVVVVPAPKGGAKPKAAPKGGAKPKAAPMDMVMVKVEQVEQPEEGPIDPGCPREDSLADIYGYDIVEYPCNPTGGAPAMGSRRVPVKLELDVIKFIVNVRSCTVPTGAGPLNIVSSWLMCLPWQKRDSASLIVSPEIASSLINNLFAAKPCSVAKANKPIPNIDIWGKLTTLNQHLIIPPGPMSARGKISSAKIADLLNSVGIQYRGLVGRDRTTAVRTEWTGTKIDAIYKKYSPFENDTPDNRARMHIPMNEGEDEIMYGKRLFESHSRIACNPGGFAFVPNQDPAIRSHKLIPINDFALNLMRVDGVRPCLVQGANEIEILAIHSFNPIASIITLQLAGQAVLFPMNYGEYEQMFRARIGEGFMKEFELLRV